jgi:hypothetical protein
LVCRAAVTAAISTHFILAHPLPAPGAPAHLFKPIGFPPDSWSRSRAAGSTNPVIDLRFLPEQAGSGGALGTFPAIALFIARTLSAS